jgi:hypothetical protein
VAVTSSDLLGYAAKYLGVPYQFGAAGPDRFDCSGFTQYVFHHFGISLPHHAADQAKLGAAVDKTAIQAGDLVFSDWGDGANSHVGIATGTGTIIDAPHTGAVVRYDKLSPSYLSHVTAVRRMDGVGGGTTTSGGGGQATPVDNGGGGFLDPYLPGNPAISAGADALSQALRPFLLPFYDIGHAAASTKTVADNVVKLWAPTSLVRGAAGIAGLILIVLGIWVLSREIRK